MQYDAENDAAAGKADFLSGLFFLILGAVVFYLSWTMPRLEARNIHPATIPGLVPMILGAALILLGALLALKSRHAAAGTWAPFLAVFRTPEAGRALAALTLVLIFALLLVGRMPFWAASMIFLFVFVVTMEAVLVDRRSGQVPDWPRAILWGAVTAIVAGAGIYYLFAELLLVRLP